QRRSAGRRLVDRVGRAARGLRGGGRGKSGGAAVQDGGEAGGRRAAAAGVLGLRVRAGAARHQEDQVAEGGGGGAGEGRGGGGVERGELAVARREGVVRVEVAEERGGDELGQRVAPEGPLVVDDRLDAGPPRQVEEDVAGPDVEVDQVGRVHLVEYGRGRRQQGPDAVRGRGQRRRVAHGVAEQRVHHREVRLTPGGAGDPGLR